jgi:hypothetical protein
VPWGACADLLPAQGTPPKAPSSALSLSLFLSLSLRPCSTHTAPDGGAGSQCKPADSLSKSKTLEDSPANLLINQGVMATLQERRLGYHARADLEPGTSGFSTLRINHYAARGIRTLAASFHWLPETCPGTPLHAGHPRAIAAGPGPARAVPNSGPEPPGRAGTPANCSSRVPLPPTAAALPSQSDSESLSRPASRMHSNSSFPFLGPEEWPGPALRCRTLSAISLP